jgi:dGTPase
MRQLSDYQQREARQLAPYAAKSAHTRGRTHAEMEHPLRSPFERDRDRVIHSSAFRKLEYKTQVFVNHEGDYYRTRLTHTLEAAQIARSAARFLHANEDLTEAIALAHDLGHPPFGHAGEDALRECMAAHGGFEHNLHSLRVIDLLERHYPDFPGLNLTWEVREGIAKHSKAFDPANPAFAAFAPAAWPSLEAQLVDVCDEIAYNAHDLDDGLAAGMITLADLNHVELWRQLMDNCRCHDDDHARYLGIRDLINLQVQDLAETVRGRVAEWALSSPDAVRVAPAPVAGLSDAMTALNAELREFLMANVYRHYRVFRMWIKAKRVIGELFRSLEAEPCQLPPSRPAPSVTPTAASNPLDGGVARQVCDYLAGLSDREALCEHGRLFDPSVSP